MIFVLLLLSPIWILLSIPLIPLSLYFGTQKVLRWPLLLVMATIVSLEFCFYALVRTFILSMEFFFVPTLRGVFRRLSEAKDYETWKKISLELDEIRGFNKWKNIDESPDYDWRLLRRIIQRMKAFTNSESSLPIRSLSSTSVNNEEQIKEKKSMRRRSELLQLQQIILECSHPDFANLSNEVLYQYTHSGTKKLIETFREQYYLSLEVIANSEELTNSEKFIFFSSVQRKVPKVGLCLSGGASMGNFHLGVIKALVDQDAMPSIVSGTSAGSLIAGLICSRTDKELQEVINPSIYSKLQLFSEPWSVCLKRFISQGTLFCSNKSWSTIQWHTKGLTFQEAFKLTGREITITSTPKGGKKNSVLLMNHLTTPNIPISSAILASAAVPILLEPIVLQEKDSNGVLRAYKTENHKWRDGSFKSDIPLSSLAKIFHVNFFIVSQVNPHIAPFFFNNRGEGGNPSFWRHSTGGWRGGFLLSALELMLKEDMIKNLRIMSHLDLLPNILGQDWSSLFLQEFYGHVTLTPPFRLKHYFRLITDPNEETVEYYIHGGQQMAWRKFPMILPQIRIGRKVQSYVEKFKKLVEFGF